MNTPDALNEPSRDRDTLVVDVTNFTSAPGYQGAGREMQLTERFARTSTGTLRYEFTIADPTTFSRPWTGRLEMAPSSELLEYACHEGNYAMRNILSASREAERSAAP